MSLGLMLRAAVARKPRFVPANATWALDGTTGPRRLADGLQPYLDVVQWKHATLPPTWPHVLASGLHLELLTRPDFPVKLLGMVHLANRIEQKRALRADEQVTLTATQRGVRETERGQEFDLHTELRTVEGEVPWSEVTTFLARRPSGEKKPRGPVAVRPPPDRAIEFEAPSNIGRTYGWIANDLNPIHLSDLTAKAFGFPRAIAHGMWSLARGLSTVEVPEACVLAVQFKTPLFLPATVRLEVRGEALDLYDAKGEKPHFAATLQRGAPPA